MVEAIYNDLSKSSDANKDIKLKYLLEYFVRSNNSSPNKVGFISAKPGLTTYSFEVDTRMVKAMDR